MPDARQGPKHEPEAAPSMPPWPDPLKLNIGSAASPLLDGYVNVDAVDFPGVDLVCDMVEKPLPFGDNTVEEIWVSHLLEHIPHKWAGEREASAHTTMLRDWWRVLKPGGCLQIVGPNFHYLARELIRVSTLLGDRYETDPEGVLPRDMPLFDAYEGAVITIMSSPITVESSWATDRYMHHWWIVTAPYIAEYLRRIGFVDVTIDHEWPKTEFCVTARKPG